MIKIVFFCLCAFAVALPPFRGLYQSPFQRPQSSNVPNVKILNEASEVRPNGFSYSYATGDGQQVQAQGSLRGSEASKELQAIQGSYSYTSPEGVPIVVNYVADENGFHAQGSHIPQIPEAIAKSLLVNEQQERRQQFPQRQPQYGPYQPQYKSYKSY